MAKKYIDAEAANKAIKLLMQELEIDDTDEAYNDALIDCGYYIDNIPAADVVEVRHGHWIADREDIEWGNSFIRYRCSECRERPHFDKEKHKFILSPYCPNCGAKMEEEV